PDRAQLEVVHFSLKKVAIAFHTFSFRPVTEFSQQQFFHSRHPYHAMSNVLALHRRGLRRPFTEHHLGHHTHRISQRRPSVPQDLSLSDKDVEKAQPLVMYPTLGKLDHNVGLVLHSTALREYVSLNIQFLRQLHEIQSWFYRSRRDGSSTVQATIGSAAELAGQLSSLSNTIFHNPTDNDYIRFCEAQSEVVALLLNQECKFEAIGEGSIVDLGHFETYFNALWEICKTVIFETGPLSLKSHQLELQTMWDAVAEQCRGDPQARPGVTSGLLKVAAHMGVFHNSLCKFLGVKKHLTALVELFTQANQARSVQNEGLIMNHIQSIMSRLGSEAVHPAMELSSWSAELYEINKPPRPMGKVWKQQTIQDLIKTSLARDKIENENGLVLQLLILSSSAEKWGEELRYWDITQFQPDFNLASFNGGQHEDLHQSYIGELHSFLYQMKLLGAAKAIPTRDMASKMLQLAHLLGEQDEEIRQLGTLTVSLGTGKEPKTYKATSVLGVLQHFARVGANKQFSDLFLAGN
ncbi:hypothetical protein T439DRAFT_235014, partial [Meredithblackwellia eburnea MCA 4105]